MMLHTRYIKSGITITLYDTAECILVRLCSALTSGVRNKILANIIAYKTPITAIHITIHKGIKTT